MARSVGQRTRPCENLLEPAEPKPDVALASGAQFMGRRVLSLVQDESMACDASADENGLLLVGSRLL